MLEATSILVTTLTRKNDVIHELFMPKEACLIFMNKRVIFYVLSLICLGICLAMLSTAAVALLYQESLWEWLGVIAVSFGVSLVCKYFSVGSMPSDVTIREGVGGVEFDVEIPLLVQSAKLQSII